MEIIDREYGRERFEEQMDTVLVFVCHTCFCVWVKLISCPGCGIHIFLGALLGTFRIDLHHRLDTDPANLIQDVLIHQMQMMRNLGLGPYVPPDFSPPAHIIIVKTLFYASLGFMFLASFFAVLIKSWVREFSSGLQAQFAPPTASQTR